MAVEGADFVVVDMTLKGATHKGRGRRVLDAVAKGREQDRTAVDRGDTATVLRPVDEATLRAWRLNGAGVSSLDAAAAAGRLVGAPWPPPALARDDDGAVFVIDAPPPLWADVSLDDRPVSLSSGERATLVLRAKNRGNLAWHDDVVIVPTADGARFCDDRWQDCGAIATLPGDTAPGDTTSVALTLQAPVVDGPTAWSLCVGLRLGAHAFGDAGMSGPDDDDVCAVITVVPAAAAGGPKDDGGGFSTPAVTGGCGCMQGDVGVDAAFAWCLALVAACRRGQR